MRDKLSRITGQLTMRKFSALTGALFLLCALVGCTGHRGSDGFYVEFGACESVPLAERATPTAELSTPSSELAPTPILPPSEWCKVRATGGLNVRATPNGTKAGAVWDGADVLVTGRDDGWLHIESPVVGWVYGRFVDCG